MTEEELRRHFPHTDDQIYVDHAATSPLGRHVMDALDAFYAQRRGDLIQNYMEFMPVVEETLERFANAIGARADQVEFMPNTSYGLSVLAEGLDWKPGDRVAVPACEFPANVYPFLNLRDRGVEVDFIPHRDGTFSIDDFEATLTPQTRLVSVSWVQFLSGFRCNLDELVRICHSRDILVSVDAIQGIGALQLDVDATGIDFLATGGQKWMMAAQGIGFIYVADHLLEKIRPRAGWMHGPADFENLIEYDLEFYPNAHRFRLGTLNSAGVASAHAALGFYLEVGPALCEKRVLANARHLDEGLRAAGLEPLGRTGDEAPPSGIVSYRTDHAEKHHEHLQKRGVTCSIRNGLLRFSPTFYNTRQEMDSIAEYIRESIDELTTFSR